MVVNASKLKSMLSCLPTRCSDTLFASLSPHPYASISSTKNAYPHASEKPPFPASFSSFQSMGIAEKGSSEMDTDSIRPHSVVDRVYEIINNKTNKENDMGMLLRESGIFLTNTLVDEVLKRVRFSHGNGLQALEFFTFATKRRGFYHTADSYDTMLYILGRMRMFGTLWDLLRVMRRKDRSLITTRTMQIVLARIAKVCSVRTTVESFNRLRKYYPGEFDTNCFNALLRTLCQEKSMTDARNVYHRLKYEFRPNVYTFNILLSGWKTVEEAESFFDEMVQLSCKPDLVSYNCLIDVLCKNKEMEKVYKIMEKMREQDIYPDLLTYTSIIGGLGLIGQPDKACDVLKEMHEHGHYPDTAAYNATIRNFCIAKRMETAFKFLDEMVEKGLAPNATTYNLFFRYFFWSNNLANAWSLYQRMLRSGCLPNTQSCMFLVRMFRRQEKAEMGLLLWNDMIENGFGSYTLVSDILLDMLCDLGRVVEAEKCFIQMIEKGHKPSNVNFRRIKVLMELSNKSEAIARLTEKMESFKNQDTIERVSGRREKDSHRRIHRN